MTINVYSKLLVASLAVLIAIFWPPAEAGQYGPFDYYNPPKGSRALVETEHFGPKVEMFKRQGNWCQVWADYDYTLRAFPNHPDALVAMAEFLEKHPACHRASSPNASPVELAAELESGAWREHDADFYFNKGITFAPKYAETRVLYGEYLRKKGRNDEALKQFQDALKLKPSSANIHYHLGMLYFDSGDSKSALDHARKAYRLGKVPEDLKQKLVDAGKWQGS